MYKLLFHNKWESQEKDYKKKLLIIFSIPLWVLILLSIISSTGAFLRGYMSFIGMLPIITIFIFLIFQSYLLFKRNYSFSSLILYLVFSLGAIFSIYSWGLVHPYGLILLVTAFYLSYMLFPSKLALLSSFILILILVLILSMQYLGVTHFDYSWEPRLSPLGSVIIGVQFIVLLIASWISSIGSTNQIIRIYSLNKKLDISNKELKNEIIVKTREIISNKTKLTKSHKVLQEAYNQLEDFEKDRFTRMNLLAHYGTLLTSVAHEMANPLMYVMSYIEDLPNDNKDRAQKSIDELVDMVRTLRGSVRISLNTEDFSISEVISDSIKLLDWKLKRNNIRIKKSIDQDVLIKGDRSKFMQIIMNILDNATSFKADKIFVEVAKKGDFNHVLITDNGKGVPNRLRDKIFQIFYSTKESGTGVGLYISRQYARDLFNGDLILENSIGNKTTFNFAFESNRK